MLDNIYSNITEVWLTSTANGSISLKNEINIVFNIEINFKGYLKYADSSRRSGDDSIDIYEIHIYQSNHHDYHIIWFTSDDSLWFPHTIFHNRGATSKLLAVTQNAC